MYSVCEVEEGGRYFAMQVVPNLYMTDREVANSHRESRYSFEVANGTKPELNLGLFDWGRAGIYLTKLNTEEDLSLIHIYVVKNDVTEVEDLLSVEEPYMKISICQKDGIEKTEQMWRRRFEGKVVPMISGNIWLDLMPFGADKGDGIALIQNRLHIMPEETMVFGDNFNDLAMFKRARYSFAMEKAHSDVKKACRYTTDMVEKILIDVLDGKYDEGGN